MSFLSDGHQNCLLIRCRVFTKPKCSAVLESWHFFIRSSRWDAGTYNFPPTQGRSSLIRYFYVSETILCAFFEGLGDLSELYCKSENAPLERGVGREVGRKWEHSALFPVTFNYWLMNLNHVFISKLRHQVWCGAEKDLISWIWNFYLCKCVSLPTWKYRSSVNSSKAKTLMFLKRVQKEMIHVFSVSKQVMKCWIHRSLMKFEQQKTLILHNTPQGRNLWVALVFRSWICVFLESCTCIQRLSEYFCSHIPNKEP